jgi:predicted metal-dependent hydrolase
MKIIRSKRKTLALEILSDASLIIRAPKLMPLFLIKKFIKQKQNWITKKQNLITARNKNIKSIKISQISKEGALKKITERVKYYSSLSGFKYKNIKITSAQKRWGSCSAQNNLNFPQKLALAPDKIIDYVVIHELCHIKEKNHSRNFWKEVYKLMPNYKIHQKWLKENGYLLK